MNELTRAELAYMHLTRRSPWTFRQYVFTLCRMIRRMHEGREPEQLARGYSEVMAEMLELDNHPMVRAARSLISVGYRIAFRQKPYDEEGRVQVVMRRWGRTIIVRQNGSLGQGRPLALGGR